MLTKWWELREIERMMLFAIFTNKKVLESNMRLGCWALVGPDSRWDVTEHKPKMWKIKLTSNAADISIYIYIGMYTRIW